MDFLKKSTTDISNFWCHVITLGVRLNENVNQTKLKLLSVQSGERVWGKPHINLLVYTKQIFKLCFDVLQW